MEELVSDFMLTATRTERRPNIRNLNVFIHGAQYFGRGWNKPNVTGSISELYIEPVLPCIGDMDLMLAEMRELALPADHPLPVNLPEGFEETVVISEIHDRSIQYPGYVFLRQICTIKRETDGTQYSIDERKMSTSDYNTHPELRGSATTNTEKRGPARRSLDDVSCGLYFDSGETLEFVYRIHCPVWPQQAAEWDTRNRVHCWPDPKTIRFIVANGCDVVPVTHRRCRQDEFMSKHQWRLSFSIAEVVLLNSWTPVQQIAYHMLRFLVKTERLSEQTDANGEKLMSNYHIKTLMLWAAELQPQKWWNGDLNLVRICRQLLKTMAVWMDKVDYKQYFIPQCNVVDWEITSQETQQIISRFQLFTRGNTLADWFFRNYVLKCVEKCPRPVQMLFDGKLNPSDGLHVPAAAVSAAARCCSMIVRRQIFRCINSMICKLVSVNFEPWLTQFHESCFQLCTLDPSLQHAFTAAWCLQTTYLLQKGISDCQLLDEVCSRTQRMMLLRTIRPSKFNASLRNELNLIQATECFHLPDALQPVTNKSTDLSLAFALVNQGRQDTETVNCHMNCYLATVYYSCGKYQSAIFHCNEVAKLHGRDKCRLFVLEGEIEQYIDADISNVLGLVLLCQFIQTAEPNQEETQDNNIVVTGELFACYLHIKCLLKLQSGEIELLRTFQYYRELLRVNVQPFIVDIILYQLAYVQLQHRTSLMSSICLCQHDNINTSTQRSVLEQDINELRRLLVLEAVKELTRFREVEKQQFSADDVVFYPREFEAMHAYNDGLYTKCYEVCREGAIGGGRSSIGWFTTTVYHFPAFFPLLEKDLIMMRGLFLLFLDEDTVNCWDIASQAMAVYMDAKCWMKSLAIREKTRLSSILQLIYISHRLYCGKPTAIFPSLMLSFVYRQIFVRLRQLNAVCYFNVSVDFPEKSECMCREGNIFFRL